MLKNFDAEKKRDQFGRLNPYGERESYEFQALRQNRALFSDDLLGDISEGVGRNQRNRREDVAKVEALLERRSGYDLERTQGPTGIFSSGLENSVKVFQERNRLKVDGLLFPKGETVQELSKPVGMPPIPERKPPVPEEKKKRDCSGVEFAYKESQSILSAKERQLDAARNSLKLLEADLVALKKELHSEKNLLTGDKGIARDMGAGMGAVIGGVLGGLPGAGYGLSAGGSLTPIIEEIIDSFNPFEKTDVELETMIRSQEKEIENIRNQILELEKEVAEARGLVEKAMNALKECKNGNKR